MRSGRRSRSTGSRFVSEIRGARTGRHPSRWIVPIPGTTKLHRLEENLGSVEVVLTPDDLGAIETSFARIRVEGARLPEQILRYSNR